ncbi:MAG: hypothetical protein EPO67_20090 [Reyranella sp.]|nr:MAG: hypothetical protein EPO67_20090 [Reyranella sp.]
MKRTLITLALVAAAGTAGAQTVTPPSVGGATVTPPSVGSGTVTTPPVNPGSVTAPSVTPPSVSVPNIANAPALPNAEGSAAAQAKITADGYSNVQGLERQPDGSWKGKAMRGGAMVDVTVDASGNVMTK